MYKSALDWLGKGFHLLPVQPNTKKQVQGFGLHQSRITNMQQAARWWKDQPVNYNLAVIAPADKFIIDFDDWGIYQYWLKQVPEDVIHTYTEITPNTGAHVFLSGTVPPSFKPIKHVEIKRVVLVAPSGIDHADYEIMFDDPIRPAQVEISLSPLSKSPLSNPPSPIVKAGDGRSKNLLDAIKAKYSILDLMREHFPKIEVLGHGRFVTSCCPFHEEKEPSFWIDTERNLFGCHACIVRGDVIIFYALAHCLDNGHAITEMSRSL
jgi:hypothetical protein